MNEASPLTLARAERGMTQAEVARRAKIRVATVNEIENGKKRPHASTLGKIAKVLRISLPKLLAYYHGKQAAK